LNPQFTELNLVFLLAAQTGHYSNSSPADDQLRQLMIQLSNAEFQDLLA